MRQSQRLWKQYREDGLRKLCQNNYVGRKAKLSRTEQAQPRHRLRVDDIGVLEQAKKKPNGKLLSETDKYHNRLIAKFRQPIESLFDWIIEKTGIQKASKARSTNALLIHCWGKLVVALYLLVFYY